MQKLKSIKIENFRCFKDIEISGFKNVNLIGGKNNAGKTSLLEALLVYFYPHPSSIIGLKRIRKESSDTIKKQPKDAWNNFFYNQDIEKNINLDGCFDNEEKKVSLSISQSLQSKIFEDNEDVKKILDFISDSNSSISILQIQQHLNDEKIFQRNLIAHSRGILSPDFPDEIDIPFIPSSHRISNEEIAKKYDKIDFEGNGEDVLQMIQMLDNSIEDIRTYSHIEPTLYLQKKNQKRGFPISLFGDAVYRVAEITLEILNEEHNVIFVDEIENGIHYTSQHKFWEALFRLSDDLKTMIFATTHSLEMIKSFMEAGQNFPDQGAYIELAHNPRTDQIIAITRDTDILEYEIEHGKPIRGE